MILKLIVLPFVAAAVGGAENFTAGTNPAVKFGVHEIELRGDGSVPIPEDTAATVKFTSPSGSTKSVWAFHDGGDTWRARIYVAEAGRWTWSTSSADRMLNGRSGAFAARDSKLRGRLLPHPKNPRHWMTENGRWFLNLNDTAYFLLSPYDASGKPVAEGDVHAYVADVASRGITSVRCYSLVGPGGYLEDGAGYAKRWRESYFAGDELARFKLDHWRTVDLRLRWMLDNYPDIYVQFVLFPRGGRYRKDDEFWSKFPPALKQRVLRNMIARYSAYPQIFWLNVNDAHYGPEFPHNNAFAREVGEWLARNDPWRHPYSTGHARFLDYYFPNESWSTYIHLENAYDLNATQYAKYHSAAKPVFLGEDRYENDHADRDPADMDYFQRRLFWAWSLSGGSANYGSRWWLVDPYSQAAARPRADHWKKGTTFDRPLRGLDSVRHIRDYFASRGIELSGFVPDHGLVEVPAGGPARLMRRDHEEFLVYHPNADGEARLARASAARVAGLRVDLSAASGSMSVEWYRVSDGVPAKGATVAGGRRVELTSPWSGGDVVVRLLRAK